MPGQISTNAKFTICSQILVEQIMCKDLSTPTVFHVGEDQRTGLALCEGPHDWHI